MHKLLTVGFVSMMCLSVMADILALREALSNVVASVDKDDLFTFDIGEIGGQHICRHPSYQALASLVSNDWQNIVGNVGNIATNQTERYLLLATGFQYGWDFHLPFFTKVADECLVGNISSNEVAWFEAYSTKCLLAVTNLLHKLIQIDGNTNVWMSIMSTNAQEQVQEYIDAGILYIPE